ncbi:MAG: CoA transferase [Desulfobacterales bacterium]|uniref:CoA transferase n=1 Tax=Candidatus Desulfatibia vada TaxID=2841696 RepID=A0A8J6P6T5_9BACT|nr:CoA transferase [Candidatus Desulfatibia vada]
MSKEGALAGITVLDLSRLLPGPCCSMMLADHGARVIAIEDKRFIADDLFITTVNRNKEHMSLNLKTLEGKEIFFRLVERADVLLEGFRPGVVHRLGIDYDTVCKINAKIIYCSITGYGQTGPCRDRAGHDVNFLAHSGVLGLIGAPDRPPSIPGVQIADIAGGGMNAAIGILLALVARERIGKGQYIDISMTDSMVSLLPLTLFLQQRTGEDPKRGETLLSHRYACYNTYETADGRYLSIGAVENRFWKRLCDHLGVPAYASLQYDEKRRLEIVDCLRTTFKQKTLTEWESELADMDICWGPVRNLQEVLQEPLFRQRNMVVDIRDQKGETTTTLGVPVKLSATPGSIRTPPVNFGESTIPILRELGYTENQIKEFADKGVF